MLLRSSATTETPALRALYFSGNRAMVARLVVLSVGNRSSTGSTTGLTMGLLDSNRRKYLRLPTTGPSRTTELVAGDRRF